MSYDPLTLADAHLRAGELEAALAALTTHLETQPDDDDARRLRIAVRRRMMGEAQARALLADVEALRHPTAEDVTAAAQAAESLGEDETALGLYERAWSLDKNPRSADLLLRALTAQAAFERALAVLFEMPRVWRWLGWTGDVYAARGDHRLAFEYYCSACDHLDRTLDTTNPFAAQERAALLLKRAEASLQLGRYDDAEADYAAAAGIVPNDPMIPFNRGLLAHLRGDTAAGLALCGAAYAQANPAIREHMRRVVDGDARYAGVRAGLVA